MNKSRTRVVARRGTVTIAGVLACAIFVVDGVPPARAGILGGAVGGAIIGGILGGDDGAEAGAIIGGIGGAAQMGARRREERRRREYYERQQYERQQRMEEERLRLERERTEMMRQSQQPPAAVPQSGDAVLVQQIQSALTLLGFNVGAADGRMTEATVEAIRAYQQSSGLLATGSASPELLEHMKQNL